jgi:hypothetical protein
VNRQPTEKELEEFMATYSTEKKYTDLSKERQYKRFALEFMNTEDPSLRATDILIAESWANAHNKVYR